jgi:hypothetical protein
MRRWETIVKMKKCYVAVLCQSHRPKFQIAFSLLSENLWSKVKNFGKAKPKQSWLLS